MSTKAVVLDANILIRAVLGKRVRFTSRRSCTGIRQNGLIGDKARTQRTIVKIVSGDTPDTLATLSAVYGSVVDAGIFEASSIRVAKAAKVIKNSRRDINIAFMNELAIIFNKIGIDTAEVLEAAGTKWNFLKFKPGLVGGHCIGVDPYYLTYQAEKFGHHPEVILAGRRINHQIPFFVSQVS